MIHCCCSRSTGGSTTGIVGYLTIFVLAAFVGNEVVSKVPSILHTPLMSGSNAIHGIMLVGAMIIMGEAHGAAQVVLGLPGRVPGHPERRRRLRRHRPHARDVQGQAGRPGQPGGRQERSEPTPVRMPAGASDACGGAA